MPSSPPERLITQLLDNPFALPARELDAAAGELAQYTPAAAEAWAARRTGFDVQRAVLAVLHARAHVAALGAGQQPETQLRAAGKAYGAEVRVACASARCIAQLRTLVGDSADMRRVRSEVWAACFGRTLAHGLGLTRLVRRHDVLIAGETGVGKEGVAHAIAEGTVGLATLGRAPFAELNAAAVPETLVESELFGHVKGAFTGAHSTRKGLVRSADGGCLFLDEVGDLPLLAQAKLLRVIETDRVQPLGTEQVHEVDVRFVAATHHDLAQRIAQGAFRADLYQRLAAVVIRVPALRERPEDIATIGVRFLHAATRDAGAAIDTGGIERWLNGAEARAYAWPGNARELRNVVGNLLLGLPTGLGAAPRRELEGAALPPGIAAGEASLESVERWYMQRVLQRTEGNVARAARVLQLDRTTVIRKLKQQAHA